MREKIRNFIEQTRARNGEHEQSLFRILFTFLIFLSIFIEYVVLEGHLINETIFIFSIICFTNSIFLAWVLLTELLPQEPRRWLMMFSDIGAVTFGMMVTAEPGIVFWGFYLWIIVGNGLRYGVNALVGSYVFSLIGFSSVILFNDYWQEHSRMSLGLLLTLILIPLYTLKLRNQLSQALENAVEANRAKSHFLANMSHEMRTPLHGVVGAGDLLRATSMNEDQIELTNTMQHSAQVLLKLIDNVLDLSKIESGKILTEKVEIDLHRLVQSTVEMFASQALEKGILLSVNFTPDTTFSLYGDSLHLRQTLINLLSNAIKFTDVGMVKLHVSTVSQDAKNTRIKFEIIDTGIGIDEKAQQSIFDSFIQANSTITEHYGGTGLGTTIASQLVKIMGGEIGLKSELGVGSIFWFELPFEKQEVNNSVTKLETLGQLRVITVGLTEHEQDTVGDYLTGWEVKFEHRIYLPSFHSTLKQYLPVKSEGLVVLCDLKNLGVNAREFASQILHISPQKNVALILLNPDLNSTTEMDYLEMGYSCLLKSPVYKTVLFNALHAIMAPQPVPGIISLRDYRSPNSLEHRNINILVAEDNGTNRKIISKMLKYGKHNVEMVEDGEKALDILENKHFDLMILDLNMPFFGGLEVMKIHRASSLRGPKTPVIILTANATLEAIQKCEEAGVDAYLTKPVNATTLLDTVAKLTSTPNKGKANSSDKEESNDENEISITTVDIDMGVLRQLSNLGERDDNFLQTVVHGFISETENLLEAQQVALTEGNYDNFKELAHMLKGSSGNIGALTLHHICREMMQIPPAKFQNSAEELLDQAKENFRSIRPKLLKHLSDTQRASV